jgi:hypothetical protein
MSISVGQLVVVIDRYLSGALNAIPLAIASGHKLAARIAQAKYRFT